MKGGLALLLNMQLMILQDESAPSTYSCLLFVTVINVGFAEELNTVSRAYQINQATAVLLLFRNSGPLDCNVLTPWMEL